jgi:MFS transporter, DHA1 family, multidrug resistance protein
MPVFAVSGTALYALANIVCRGTMAILGIIAAETLGFSVSKAAMIVGFGVLAMRFGRIAVVPLSVFGPQRMVAFGFLFSALGLAGIAAGRCNETLPWVGVALLGIGYGAVVLSIKVALVEAAETEDARLRVLAWLSMGVNLGAAIGPSAAGLLLSSSGARAALIAGAVVCSTAAGVSLLVSSPLGKADSPQFRWRDLACAFTPGVRFQLLVLMVAFFLYAQLSSTLPVHVARSSGPALIGLVFTLNALIVIVLQVPVTIFTERSPGSDRHAAPAGLFLFGAGFAILAISSELSAVLGCVFLISIAECLLLPYVERDLAQRLQGRGLAVAFSLSAAAMGLGETLGATVGVSAALQSSNRLASLMIVLAVVGICFALIVEIMSRRDSPKKHNNHPNKQEKKMWPRWNVLI